MIRGPRCKWDALEFIWRPPLPLVRWWSRIFKWFVDTIEILENGEHKSDLSKSFSLV